MNCLSFLPTQAISRKRAIARKNHNKTNLGTAQIKEEGDIPKRLFHYLDAPHNIFEYILPQKTRLIEYNPCLRYFSHPTPDKWFNRCRYLPKEETLLWTDGQKHITIYLNGLGSPKMVAALKKYYLNDLPGCIASFDFIETSDLNLFDKIKYINIGQKIDGLITLWVIAQVNNDCNPDVIHLYGTSRGGAAAVIAEAILIDTSCKILEEDLKQIGITPQLRNELLTKIQRGARILDVPLCNIKRSIKRRTPTLINILKKGVCLTRCQTDGPHPEEFADIVNPHNRKSFVYFEQHDALVGNMQDNAKLWTPWIEKNPETTIVMEGNNGDDIGLGGHLHTMYGGAEHMGRALHTFMARHNFPHDPRFL